MIWNMFHSASPSVVALLTSQRIWATPTKVQCPTVLTVPDVWNAPLQICTSPLPNSNQKLFVIVSSGCNKNTICQIVYKPQEFISLSSTFWKSEIMVSSWLGSGEGHHLGCKLLTLCCVLICQKEGERVINGLFHSSLIVSMRAAPS